MIFRFIRSASVPLILAVLVLLFMLPFLRPPTGNEVLDGHDLVNQQYPLYSFIFDSVRNGEGLPLWNPYQFAGQSIASNPQSTIFYPPAWIMLPLGVPRGVGWLFIFHLWWGGWGMAQFVRRLGATQAGSLAGGIIYMFSGVIAAHLNAGHLNYLMCSAWLPWLAVAYLWGVGRKKWVFAALPGAAAFGLCILTGHPPMLYFGVLWLAVMGIYVIWTGQAQSLRAIRFLMVILIGGGILGAALLLPVADFTVRSTRASEASLGFSNSYSIPAGQVLTLAFPNLFGEPNNGYWGVPFYEELTAYIGLLPLIALFAVRRRPATILLTVFVVVGLIVSLGIEGGLFSILYAVLPGYSLFRVPSRALYFVTVGGAGLAALYITDLQTSSREERVISLRRILWILPALAILCAALAFVVTSMFNAGSADANPPWRVYHTANIAALTALTLGGIWLALRLWTAEWLNVRWALVLTIFIVLVDVWRIAQPLVTVSTVDVPPLWQAMAQAAPASPDFRVMTVPNDITWQAGATYSRHLNANGYDPLVSDDYQRLLDASGYKPTSPIARLLGVRYVISDKPYESSGLASTENLSELFPQNGDWHVYMVANSLPRVFSVQYVQVLDDESGREALSSGTIDALRTVILNQAADCGTPPPDPLPVYGEGEKKNAHITQYAPNVIDVTTTSDQPGILVLTDSYDPNWMVTVDGTPATLLRVDTALRGVCVSAGEHQVHFAYQPRAFYVGVAISVAGWLVWGIMGGVVLVKSRRRGTEIGTD
ncbi:MAG: YfhO family protein [Chloroflexota bacterium]